MSYSKKALGISLNKTKKNKSESKKLDAKRKRQVLVQSKTPDNFIYDFDISHLLRNCS